jgi:hypothetical protein
MIRSEEDNKAWHKSNVCNSAFLITVKVKVKAIPVTGHGGLYSCEMSRIAHCLDSRLLGCQPCALAVLYPQKDLLVLISVTG